MDPTTEIRIPLLWNANGYIEVIKHDDISPIEAEKVTRLFQCNNRSPNDNDEFYSPLTFSSNEVDSKRDSHDTFISDTKRDDDQMSDYLLCLSRRNKLYNSDYDGGGSIYLQSADMLDKYVKDHACELCGKQFSRKFNLNTHIKCVHSDEKDYVCNFCNRAFNHSSNLRKHVKTVHSGGKPLSCPVCDKSFKTVGAMKGHIRVIHGVRDGY